MTTPSAAPASPTEFSSLERAVVLTVLYSDLFGYPLHRQELYRHLLVPCPDRQAFDEALRSLDGGFLERVGEWIFWKGRQATIEQRQKRHALAAMRWSAARRFARWLTHVPFLRMVAVCGSQAVENADEKGDVDLFLITEPGRLWLVQATTMVLRRLGRLVLSIEICPNYLLTLEALEVRPHHLYAAREVAQAVPLWGKETYGRFLNANRWLESFQPQADLERPDSDRRRFLEPQPPSAVARRLERLLAGRLGDGADRLIHRLLLAYYRLRLFSRGWSREQITRAYRRDRQVLITGGYTQAIASRFAERVAEATADAISAAEAERCFWGNAPDSQGAADPHFAKIFSRRYRSVE